MILSKPGESIQWGNMTFTVGEQVYATNTSEHHGLIGTITEIRDGDDKDTENYLPDIYCSFQEPVLTSDREELEKRFSTLYRCPKKLEDIALDMTIMGPDMLIPMKVLDIQHKTITVYHIYEDWSANDDCGSSVIPSLDYDDAKRRLIKMLTEEMENGSIADHQDKTGFVVEQKKDYYCCWMDGAYFEFHYKIFIKEEQAVLTDRILSQIGREYRDAVLRDEFSQQIADWEEVSDFTDEELDQLIQQPGLPDALREALDNHSSYWETYWDAISGKASALIRDFRKKIGKAQDIISDSNNEQAAESDFNECPFIMQICKEDFDAINTAAYEHRELTLNGDKFIIRPFKDWFDILKESREQKHAVAVIAKNRYGIGLDYLFAMRKAEDPETPYITLEFLCDGRLSQCRKQHCKPVTEADELAFVEEFRTKILLPYINSKEETEG